MLCTRSNIKFTGFCDMIEHSYITKVHKYIEHKSCVYEKKNWRKNTFFLSSRRKLRLITSLFRLGLLAKYEWPILLFIVGNTSFEYFLSNCNQITTYNLFFFIILIKLWKIFNKNSWIAFQSYIWIVMTFQIIGSYFKIISL